MAVHYTLFVREVVAGRASDDGAFIVERPPGNTVRATTAGSGSFLQMTQPQCRAASARRRVAPAARMTSGLASLSRCSAIFSWEEGRTVRCTFEPDTAACTMTPRTNDFVCTSCTSSATTSATRSDRPLLVIPCLLRLVLHPTFVEGY
jgi:hypothetical protein